jgi:FAD/FMN-containing dehydrogenase
MVPAFEAPETSVHELQRTDPYIVRTPLVVAPLSNALPADLRPRVPAQATAFAHRDRPIMANVAAFSEGSHDRAVREAWVADFAAALRQGDPGAYVGFLADEGQARVREAYPEPTWDRLTAIKRRYDPTNLFRLNQNIPPATEDTQAP